MDTSLWRLFKDGLIKMCEGKIEKTVFDLWCHFGYFWVMVDFEIVVEVEMWLSRSQGQRLLTLLSSATKLIRPSCSSFASPSDFGLGL